MKPRDHRHELFLAEQRLLLFERRLGVIREIEHFERSRRLVEHETPKVERKFRQELHRVFAARQKIRDRLQDFALSASADRLRQAVDRLAPDEAQTLLDALRRQRAAVEARALVEERERISHAAVRLLREKAQRFPFARDLHLFRHIRKPRFDLLDGDASEIKALAARLDRRRHLVRLRRRKDENDMRGRLFERLQQRVERLCRQHVHLVDDVDLVASFGGRELHLLAQVPHLVDAAVRRRIDLEDVERRAVGDLRAALAYAAGIGRRPLLAVQ